MAWIIKYLPSRLEKRGKPRKLAGKIFLMKDCTSPVGIPVGEDFTDAADSA